MFDIVALFGYVRETVIMGVFLMCAAKIDPTNLAYTRAGLQVHTDNPYRDPVPSLQLLYCLDILGKTGARTHRDDCSDGFVAVT